MLVTNSIGFAASSAERKFTRIFGIAEAKERTIVCRGERSTRCSITILKVSYPIRFTQTLFRGRYEVGLPKNATPLPPWAFGLREAHGIICNLR
jgi:hypothetical protein